MTLRNAPSRYHANRFSEAAARTAPRRRRVAVLALLAAAAATLVAVPAAQAAATMQLSVGADPAESITTQLGASGTGTGSGDNLYLNVKSAGGQACAANPSADNGQGVIGGAYEPNATYSETRNWTFDTAGSYLLCGWLMNAGTVVAQASQPFSVRPPHLALTIAAPASVHPGQTFQVVTTAQAETGRDAYEYILPNTGGICPANAGAANSASGSISAGFNNSWHVIGGPISQPFNQTFSTLGSYLFCAYFQYPRVDSVPEATASATTTVVAPPPPCIVPSLRGPRTLSAVERRVLGGHCTVGRINYSHSRKVRRRNVIALTPRPGTRLSAGAAVRILVSRGPAPQRRRHS